MQAMMMMMMVMMMMVNVQSVVSCKLSLINFVKCRKLRLTAEDVHPCVSVFVLHLVSRVDMKCGKNEQIL